MNRERIQLGALLALLVPVGLLVKYHVTGAYRVWCFYYGAAVVYEVFWVFALRFAFSRLSPAACGAIVLLGTCVIECLQLWRPAWLMAVRGTWLGAALLGTSFDPWDFPHYVLGSALGAVLLWLLVRRHRGGRGATADG
ncbi:MAG: DUF2809 domain-containing protein [Kiritimatiellae bacterium]|nr:DUF2809 domain-containing protein [Kiritimatiellia bacterium]